MNSIQQCELEILQAIDAVCKANKIEYMISSGTLLGAARHKGFIPWDDDLDIVMTMKNYRRFLKIGQKCLGDRFFLQTAYTDSWPRNHAKVRMNGTAAIEEHYTEFSFHQGIWVDVFPLVGAKEDKNWLGRYNKIIDFRNFLVSDEVYQKMLRDNAADIHPKTKLLMKIPRSIRKIAAKLLDRVTLKKLTGYPRACIVWGGGHLIPEYMAEDYCQTVELEFEGQSFPAPKNWDRVLTMRYKDYMTLPPESERVDHSLIYADANKDYKEYLRSLGTM